MPSTDPSRPATLLARTAEPQCGADLPPGLDDALYRSPTIEVSRDRGLVRVPGIARYRIGAEGVHSVAEPGSTHADVRCFLAGTVRALDLVLHEVFSLRAAAVRIDGRAVLLGGPSASGKSVLAAALARRGHALLADQLAPVVLTADGPVLWPTADAVQLWPPAAARLGMSELDAQIVRPALAKRSYRFGDGCTGDPVRVGLLVVLSVASSTVAATSTSVDGGLSRIRTLATAQLHRAPAERRDPLAQFGWLAEMGAALPTVSVTRARGQWTIDELVEVVERETAAVGGPG